MKELIEKIKKEIIETEREITKKIKEQEEPLTGRFLGILGDRLNRVEDKDYNIDTNIYDSRRVPEEKIIGADFIIILNINNKKYSVSKYFLSQAKKEKKKEDLKFDSTLRSQCKKMIGYTSDSFIFVYTPKGIFITSALNHELIFKDLSSFFEDFFGCFIGDIHPIPFWPFSKKRDLIFWNKKELSRYLSILEIDIAKKD